MARSRIINVTGIDGSGKTTVVEWLSNRLSEVGCDVEIRWLRFNHFFTKPLLAYCRLVGLTQYENVEGVRIGYHEFHRSKVVSWLFVYLQYLDALRVKAMYIPRLWIAPNRVLLLDRYIYDILIDLEIDTGIRNLDRTRIGKALLRLLPPDALVLPILRDERDVLEARAESRIDKNFRRRFRLYEEMPMRYQLSEIRNNTTLDDLLGAVAEKVGFLK